MGKIMIFGIIIGIIALLISGIFAFIRFVFSNATQDYEHFIAYGGFGLILVGPWMAISEPLLGTKLYHFGLLLLMIVSLMLTISYYRDDDHYEFIDETRPFYLQMVVTTMGIWSFNWLASHGLVKVLKSFVKWGGQADYVKYEHLAMHLHGLLVTLIIIGIISLFATEPISDKLYDWILDPLYDLTHHDDDEPSGVPLPGQNNIKTDFGQNSQDVDDLKSNLAKSIASDHKAKDLEDEDLADWEKAMTPKDKQFFDDTDNDDDIVDDGDNDPYAGFYDDGQEDSYDDGLVNDAGQPVVTNELRSFDQRGLEHRKEKHVRIKLFSQYHSRCSHCGRDAVKDKVRLYIDFKNKGLAKKYQELNQTNPSLIPLSALAVVCELHTIDALEGHYRRRRYQGSGGNGRILVSDIRAATQKYNIPSYDADRALQYHPDWKAKLLKRYHYTCQICGHSPVRKHNRRVGLKIDFKNMEAANKYLKLNQTHPEQIPMEALSVFCGHHDIKYMASQTALFYTNRDIFKAQQRRLASSVILRRYITQFGNNGMGKRCAICGRDERDIGVDGKPLKLHLDHIYPVSRGGMTRVDNLRWLCNECNNSKSDLVTVKPSNYDE